jgi:hypothetical protein
VGEGREKLLHLRVALLLTAREIEKRKTSANERRDQDPTFPKQHLVVTIKLSGVFEVRLID